MAEGRSYASFAAAIGVGVGVLDDWTKKHVEFKRAKEVAKLASMGKWEELALKQAEGSIKGSASTLVFMLKNRFPDYYKDAQEVKHSGDLTFIMNTGIDRSPDAAEIEDTSDIVDAEFKEVDKDSDLL